MFQIGDIVQLTCGGTTMTVICVEGIEISVVWHNSNNSLEEAVLPETALLKLEEDNGEA